MTPLPTAGDVLLCENCQAENAPDKRFCTQCRFPITGTDEEKGFFRSEIAKNRILLKDAEEKIKSAKNTIFILAGFSLLVGIILYFSQDDVASFVVYVLIAILYLALAAWCSNNPFGAILTAFIVYITLQLVSAFVDPVSLVSGILWKIIFIGALIKGIRSASEARSYIRELEKSKVTPVGSYY
jgi:1,4-dihydroxy-2-naphthoate octaprenyltransferase